MVYQDIAGRFTITLFVLLTSWSFSFAVKGKWRAPTPILQQEHLLRNLPEYEIGYPTETSHDGKFIRHVTSPDHRRRIRRSISKKDGPVYYNITYRGTSHNMKLRLNEELLGSGFVVERRKKGGKVEKTRFTENCYLVGETSGYNLSVALSDCDGLLRITCYCIYAKCPSNSRKHCIEVSSCDVMLTHKEMVHAYRASIVKWMHAGGC